jgi:hypothetical protein
MITITYKMPFRAIAAAARAFWYKLFGYEVLAATWRADYRMQHCEACPQYDAENDQCRKCGCLVSAKVMLNSEKCPLDKWSRQWIKKSLPGRR